MKKKQSILFIMLIVISSLSCTNEEQKVDDLFTYAKTRTDDLKLGIYITAQAVDNLLSTDAGKREAISLFRCNGITKAVIESYRSGLVVNKDLLMEVKKYFERNGIEVVGGIATVPGGDFGVKQEGQLGWFNWQNPKTQKDLKEVMQMSAEVFDEFIVDDFLCTADTSDESKLAKGNRSWSQYRRDLLTELSTEIFIKPAKEANPNIKMIIKYPQWYDRFHLFGYELEREPQLFDKVWVGTESRGQFTQRYGFVQPYEGFINYRWIKDIAKDKIGGAWFDHGDCDENDFIEQAYQSVLAGASEIVIFNYYDFINGHKAHHYLRTQFEQLADLAKFVKTNQAEGIVGYKPINSDAGGDLYIMDFIGALGIPLVPVHQYPTDAKVIFLPTQAAVDKEILQKIENSIASGATIIFTTGFLANVNDGAKIANLAGIKYPVVINPISSNELISGSNIIKIEHGLDLESAAILTSGKSLLDAVNKNRKIPFLIRSEQETNIFTLNSHTFSQQDFDNVGEVLLCPKPLGLLEIPKNWANQLRKTFLNPIEIEIDAPTKVTVQKLGLSDYVFHNYNKKAETISFKSAKVTNSKILNVFTGEEIKSEKDTFSLNINPRSRIWIKIK